MTILDLTIQKRWFDLILSGEKTMEYRRFCPYYSSRINKTRFSHIKLRNGYRPDSPFLIAEILHIYLGSGALFSPSCGEHLSGSYYGIHIGAIVEKGNT